MIWKILIELFATVIGDILKTPAKETHVETVDGILEPPANLDPYKWMLNRG